MRRTINTTTTRRSLGRMAQVFERAAVCPACRDRVVILLYMNGRLVRREGPYPPCELCGHQPNPPARVPRLKGGERCKIQIISGP